MAAKKGDGLLMVYCDVAAEHDEEKPRKPSCLSHTPENNPRQEYCGSDAEDIEAFEHASTNGV